LVAAAAAIAAVVAAVAAVDASSWAEPTYVSGTPNSGLLSSSRAAAVAAEVAVAPAAA